MKAKEYANQFLSNQFKNEEDINKAITKSINGFMSEISIMMEQRGCNNNDCIKAILMELSDKWRAFANIVNKEVNLEVIKKDGFKQFVILNIPESIFYFRTEWKLK